MGLLDWFKSKPKAVDEVDVVWLNGKAKFGNLRREIELQLQNSSILVVCQFPATLDRLEQELEGAGVEVRCLDTKLRPPDFVRMLGRDAPGQALLILADGLVADEFPGDVDEQLPVTILVAERHLLNAKDQPVFGFARSLGRRCQVRVHTALDDPLLGIFAGEWITKTLRLLGVTESQPIESPMVTRRIKEAQAKFATDVIGTEPAESAEEWVLLNMPR